MSGDLDGAGTARLLLEARELRSEHGENVEYDRALVELTARCLDIGQDEMDEAYALVGVIRPAEVAIPAVGDGGHVGTISSGRITCSCGWDSGHHPLSMDAGRAFRRHREAATNGETG